MATASAACSRSITCRCSDCGQHSLLAVQDQWQFCFHRAQWNSALPHKNALHMLLATRALAAAPGQAHRSNPQVPLREDCWQLKSAVSFSSSAIGPELIAILLGAGCQAVQPASQRRQALPRHVAARQCRMLSARRPRLQPAAAPAFPASLAAPAVLALPAAVMIMVCFDTTETCNWIHSSEPCNLHCNCTALTRSSDRSTP